MHSHMHAHPYALNEIILADTTESVSSGLQFPVLKNMTSNQDKKHIAHSRIQVRMSPNSNCKFTQYSYVLHGLMR